MIYEDRIHAGRLLAEALQQYGGQGDVVVLGLPRGGVPVAAEIAATLDAPLDVYVVRKLGLPGQEELAMGAIASGEVLVANEELRHALPITQETIDSVAARERLELARRERAYRDHRPFPEIRDRTVILVDDGIATGTTMRAAIIALRSLQPARLVVAVPVAARSIADELSQLVDELVCLQTPEYFGAVGSWYRDFSQVEDSQVRDILNRAAETQMAQRK